MTDKIIIDNVDVSGCWYYDKKTGICKGGYRVDEIPYCDCFDCDHKRLKRTQNQYNAVVEQNKSLQQELQAEKEKVKELEEENRHVYMELNATNTANGGIQSLNKLLEEKNNKYKQALAEIKELCILSCDDCEFKNSSVCENNECFCNDSKVDEILQKCEVLDV